MTLILKMLCYFKLEEQQQQQQKVKLLQCGTGFLPQDVGKQQHLQHQEGVGEALAEGRSPHHPRALVGERETMRKNVRKTSVW